MVCTWNGCTIYTVKFAYIIFVYPNPNTKDT